MLQQVPQGITVKSIKVRNDDHDGSVPSVIPWPLSISARNVAAHRTDTVVTRVVFGLAWKLIVIGAVVLVVLWVLGVIGPGSSTLG